MALIFPDIANVFATDGEEMFFAFLRDAALPNDRFTAWYRPHVSDREPDFILYGNGIGLVVFEVKDWTLDQILAADPEWFKLQIGNREERRPNPWRQATDYVHAIMNLIQKDGRLVSPDPAHRGKPGIPVQAGIVFPHITRQAFIERGLDKVIDPCRILFMDHVHPASDVCGDPSGERFRRIMAENFPPLFPFKLGTGDYNHLRELLFPEVRIREPIRGASSHESRVALLDAGQEMLARRLGDGHSLILGPSGSGKTLVLTHKAGLLLQGHPKVKNVLLVCFNIALVNALKRQLTGLGVPLGRPGVEVLHFYDLAVRILGEPVRHEEEEYDYYQLVTRMAAETAAESGPAYHAVLVDEGQDFSDEMLATVAGVVDPEVDILTVAADEDQALYSWTRGAGVKGLDIGDRVVRLEKCYRNTAEISAAAAGRLGGDPGVVADGKSGPKPEMVREPDTAAACGQVADRVAKLAAEGVPLSEIAVLYMSKTMPGFNEPLPLRLVRELEARCVPAHWMSENYWTKRSFDQTADRVAVSTIHSAKGMDWRAVVLVGLGHPPHGRWDAATLDRLGYVGMTRARERLVVVRVGVG